MLEPLALLPQLLVFRGCTDAGRLACKLQLLAWVKRGVVVVLAGAETVDFIFFRRKLRVCVVEDMSSVFLYSGIVYVYRRTRSPHC